MATQKDEAKRLEGIAATLSKVAKETDQTLVEIEKLKALATSEEASPELVAQIDAVEALVKGIDDKVPDVTL